MGLSGLPGTWPQQAHQMALDAPQQMNPNVRQGMPSGMPDAAPKPTEGTGIGLNMSVNGVKNTIQRPSREQINNAAMFVQRKKKEYMTRSKSFTLRRVRRAHRPCLSFTLQI